jgi:hypothetical protein
LGRKRAFSALDLCGDAGNKQLFIAPGNKKFFIARQNAKIKKLNT